MAESMQQKCSKCKKMGIIRCEGCDHRFCLIHFNEHRQHLDILFEQVCNDRNSLCEQINDSRSTLASTNPQLMHLFNEIDECEIKTLEMVQQTADCSRQQLTELMNSNNAVVEAELDQISKELRRRKEDNDYLEQDIERLSKNLEQIQVNVMAYSPDIELNITPIDWPITIRIKTETSNQLFVGGTLLTKDHQLELNRLYGNENQKWQLVYKATQDGFDPDICHQCCDNQGPTLTIIKASEKYLFGGYTAVDWDLTHRWMFDKNAFLFTLINPHNIPPTKYMINSLGENSILSNFSSGPVFGGWDICIFLRNEQNNESFIIFPTNYIDSTERGHITFTGSQHFSLTDLEIYRLAV